MRSGANVRRPLDFPEVDNFVTPAIPCTIAVEFLLSGARFRGCLAIEASCFWWLDEL